MMASSPTCGRRLAGALAGLVLGLVVVPGAAQAGCGWPHERPAFGLERLERLNSTGSADDRPARPGPCPGGICAPDDADPLPPPAQAPRWFEQWPCPLDPLRWPAPAAALLANLDDPPYAPPSPSALERPPRPR